MGDYAISITLSKAFKESVQCAGGFLFFSYCFHSVV